MKQAEYNEIDTLLRDLARRERAAETDTESAPEQLAAKGAHLDADELSSYAERALPASARARCTAHLADCDDCRKIVVHLSLAAGPLTEEQRIEKSSVVGLTWTQRLSALFSPRLIRYAAPALAVVVLAVAFFAWRQQQSDRRNAFVARNESAQPAPAAKAPSEQAPVNGQLDEANTKAGGTTRTSDQNGAKSQPTSVSTAPAKPAKAEGDRSDEKKSGGDASGSTASPSAGKQDARAADKAGEPYASEPASAPPAKPSSTIAATQEQQNDLAKNNVSQEQQRQRDAIVQQRKGPARNDNEVASQRGPAKRDAQPAAKLKAAETSSAAGARTEDDEAETRTVFGRHFRRVSNAWVDTAYKSSMSIRSVSRGTEEFRALVADEPAIGSIGQQLNGEVIVIWKGHAYRIN